MFTGRDLASTFGYFYFSVSTHLCACIGVTIENVFIRHIVRYLPFSQCISSQQTTFFFTLTLLTYLRILQREKKKQERNSLIDHHFLFVCFHYRGSDTNISIIDDGGTVWSRQQNAVSVRHAFKQYGSKSKPNQVLINLNMTVAKGTM